ncbi:hypothetical protein [Pseudoneobacillus sp. C159]
MIKKLFLVFSIVICPVIFAALTVKPTVSYACKCVKQMSVEEQLEFSDTVFKGKIIEIKQKRHARKILFEVSNIWKGISTSQIELIDEPSSCSIDFMDGQGYLVYAKNYGNDVLTTNICDRTVELKNADNDLLLLGEGGLPTEMVNYENEIYHFNVIWWLPIIVIPVLIVSSFIWKRKRVTK